MVIDFNHKPEIRVDVGRVQAEKVNDEASKRRDVNKNWYRFKIPYNLIPVLGAIEYWNRTEMVPVEYYYKNAAITMGLFAWNSLIAGSTTIIALYEIVKGIEKLVN